MFHLNEASLFGLTGVNVLLSQGGEDVKLKTLVVHAVVNLKLNTGQEPLADRQCSVSKFARFRVGAARCVSAASPLRLHCSCQCGETGSLLTCPFMAEEM